MDISSRESEFNHLVFEHQAMLHKICHIYSDTMEDRQDLFQEIVINLWKGFSGFRQQSSFSTWMYRVALNTAISQKRKSKNRLGKKEQLKEFSLQTDDHSSRDAEVRSMALYKGIQQLKKIEKAVILLYLEGKSYKEIADITGLSKTNVSVRLVRIKTKLGKLVKSILSNS